MDPFSTPPTSPRVIDFAALRAPFPLRSIRWRLQRAGEKNGRLWAIVNAYVDARAVMDRLDEVVGPENWKSDFRDGADGTVLCTISIRIERADGRVDWISRTDGAPARKGDNLDMAIKGGLSAALKRTAVQFGIGRFLYNLDDLYAVIHDDGRYPGRFKDEKNGKEEKRFRWNPPQLPAWALPPGESQQGNRERGGQANQGGTGQRRPETARGSSKPEPPVIQPKREWASTPPGSPLHDAMLAFITRVGRTLTEDVPFDFESKKDLLKAFVRSNWDRLHKEPSVAAIVVAAIAAASGQPFAPEALDQAA